MPDAEHETVNTVQCTMSLADAKRASVGAVQSTNPENNTTTSESNSETFDYMCKPSQPPEGRGGTQNQTKLDSNLESSVSASAQSNSEWECTLAETELCEVDYMCDYIAGSVVRKIISKKDSCELCKKMLTTTSDPAAETSEKANS